MKASTSRKKTDRTCGSARLSPDFQFPANDEQVHQRAQVIYRARGGIAGMTLDDWLKAELELKRELAQTVTNNAEQNYENDQF